MHDVTEGGVATAIREMAEAAGLGAVVAEAEMPRYYESKRLLAYYGLDILGAIGSGALLIACAEAGTGELLRRLREAEIAAHPRRPDSSGRAKGSGCCGDRSAGTFRSSRRRTHPPLEPPRRASAPRRAQKPAENRGRRQFTNPDGGSPGAPIRKRTPPELEFCATAPGGGPDPGARRPVRNCYLAEIRKCARRFCCQQPSLLSMHCGRSLP